ncbi:MAG: helix-turn-helix transcriptional regulator [Nitrospirae bacterium]|nr:helix-turn-helix transcriptional regulator [Nitrospirota bacterium]
MLERATAAARRIIEGREVPGLLLLNGKGRLLCSNPAADALLPEIHRQAIVKLIQQAIQTLLDCRGDVIDDPAAAAPSSVPFYQSTFQSGPSMFGLQAFWVNRPSVGHQSNGRQSGGRAPLVAILVERVAAVRSGRGRVENARRRFQLSPRELEVIQALRIGMSDKEIAVSLGISFDTVRDYLKTIRRKLGVSARAAIVNTVTTA